MEILATKNLNFKYPSQEENAIENFNLAIKAGEFVVVCGKSGCGKSTLLRLLKREISPHGEMSGEIFYNGVPLEKLSDAVAAGEIGFVMQNPENQIVTDKAWHELAFGMENLGFETAVIRRRVGEMASFFGIDDFFRSETATLSGGQKQLLNLASVMVMSPQVLILDEPTSQLDPIAAADFIAMLWKINKELGVTIVLAEHRLEEVFPLADKVLLMADAKKLLFDAPQEVGKKMQEVADGQDMMHGLPSAVRIFNGVGAKGACPLTVRDGRGFINENYKAGFSWQKPLQAENKNKTLAMQCKNVWFKYEKDTEDILENININLHSGEIFAILGSNGAGKSSLLKVIAGQNKAYKGRVNILGEKIEKYKNGSLYKGVLAFLSQNPQSTFLKPTVLEDFMDICEVMEYSENFAKSEIERLCEKIGILHLVNRNPFDLSGGEQQKVALTKVLLLQPRILLLDEPTKGIDAHAKHKLGEILQELKKDGLAVLMVTHDVEFAAENAQQCALLFDAQMMTQESAKDFFAGNQFYTTASNRIARGRFANAITCTDVINACEMAKKEGFAI